MHAPQPANIPVAIKAHVIEPPLDDRIPHPRAIDAIALALDAQGFAQAIEDTKPLPGSRGCRMPGASGYKSLMSNAEEVKVLASHWEPFFKTQAGRHGWTEESLRADWEAQK